MMKTEYTRTTARQRRIRLIRFLPEKLLLFDDDRRRCRRCGYGR